MLSWTRRYGKGHGLASIGDDGGLYLIPIHDGSGCPLDSLRGSYDRIFSAELGLWCEDQATWPSPRPFERFQQWFDFHFYNLVDDLGRGPLRPYEEDARIVTTLRRTFS